MRMDGQEESSNVEDVRGMGGGGGGFGFGGRGLSIGGIVIAVIVGWIFGINPLQLLGVMDGGGGGTAVQQQGPAPAPPKDDPAARFVSQVLRSTEQVWTDVFRESGRTYQPPKLVLFSGSWPTACGQGQSAMGPFYCPEDRKVYIDLSFYRVLEQKLGARGTLIGRAFLYGLGAMGEAGVTRTLEIIARELEITMAFCGHTDIRNVDRSILLPGTFPRAGTSP